MTGADGRASVGADRGVSTTLRFSKPGFADQFKAFTLPASAESGYLEVMMTPRMAAATLADAAAGGTIDGSDGARVSFEPGSLVDAAGAPVIGAVQVSITPIDVAANVRAFPGKFEGTRPTGQQGLIESYGTAEFILTQGGAPVQLAPGRKATIEIPIYIAKNRDGSAVKEGDPFPLWSLNERTGTWIEEGSGNVVVAASPSGFALRGEVTHFSWWNHDQFLFPIAKPKPKCLVDTNADGILEDLTGTGHCWHAGTGPDQPTAFAPLATGSDRKRILAEPRTQRIPTWVAEDFTPASGGKVLLIPANLDITFRSYAKNGTLFGTTVVRLGADVEQDVPMLLEPVQDNPGTRAIALPFDDRFAVATRAEVDRFTFAAEAGAAYDILISRATSSLLGGSVRVLGVNGASAASGNFGTDAYAAVVTASAAGTMTVEITAGDAAPGSYRIEVRKLAGNGANCAGPATTLALPSTGEHPIAANGALCFDLPLIADDAIEVLNTSATVARGNVRLLGPNGEQIAIDGYGGSAGAFLLRFAAAQTGTYRLQLSNTEPLAGTIHGLRGGPAERRRNARPHEQHRLLGCRHGHERALLRRQAGRDLAPGDQDRHRRQRLRGGRLARQLQVHDLRHGRADHQDDTFGVAGDRDLPVDRDQRMAVHADRPCRGNDRPRQRPRPVGAGFPGRAALPRRRQRRPGVELRRLVFAERGPQRRGRAPFAGFAHRPIR